LFIHEDKFVIEGIHFKLQWLLSPIVLLVKYLLQSHVAFTIYLCPFHFGLCEYILPRRLYIFNSVHSAMSEMHQRLALQFQRTVMICPGRLPATLLAIMFEIFIGLLSESRQIPGQ
jgi:hypothetical protein